MEKFVFLISINISLFHYLIRLPFDGKTPFGYGALTVIQGASFIFICHMLVLALGILMGYFFMATACAKDIRRRIRDTVENWMKYRNKTKTINKYRGVLIYTSQLKELSQLRFHLLHFHLVKIHNNCKEIEIGISVCLLNFQNWMSIRSHFSMFGAFWPFAIHF